QGGRLRRQGRQIPVDGQRQGPRHRRCNVLREADRRRRASRTGRRTPHRRRSIRIIAGTDPGPEMGSGRSRAGPQCAHASHPVRIAARSVPRADRRHDQLLIASRLRRSAATDRGEYLTDRREYLTDRGEYLTDGREYLTDRGEYLTDGREYLTDGCSGGGRAARAR